MTTIHTLQKAQAVTAASVDEAPPSSSAELGSLLPDPVGVGSFGGDIGAELAALAVKTGQAQEDGARTERDTDEQMEVKEDNAEVADMHAKAGDIRNAGIVDGVGMMAQGAAGIGGASFALQFPGSAKADMAIGEGAGQLLDGAAKIGSAFYNADGANRDADAAAHRANADQFKTAAEDMHDAQKSGADFVSAALDFYKEYSSSVADANKAAIHAA
jgi:hypothetical protein